MKNSYKSVFVAVLLATIGLSALSAKGGEATQYDDMSPRSASKILPPDLLKGELWTVADEVIPVEGLFQFQVQSAWGEFPVWGEAMLRLRLREFRAIAELETISSTEAALKGAGKSAGKSFVRLGNAIVHPKRTAKALPQGTRRLFGKIKRYSKKATEAVAKSSEEKPNDSQNQTGESSAAAQEAAVWLARKYGGVGSKYRDRARDLGVDPYTSNEVLASELERVSRAEAAGSVSSKFFLPVIGQEVGLMADAANIAYVREWREIFAHNDELMRQMGVSQEQIFEFEKNENFTPMTQTIVVAMLDAMQGVEGRNLVIQQAAMLQNESEALFFLESVLLAEWYHREQNELKKFLADTLIPVATNKAGNLVAFTAADFFYWTPETEIVARDFTATYADHPGGRELILADYISSRARKNINAMGWQVMSSLRQQYDVEIPWGAQDHD